ncbi:ABC transporter permease [bacterium]|nr:ABC transporter permease [bacterium]
MSLFLQAWAELRQQPFRSLLTALGIVFGVGAVIAILAISEGARREALSQLDLLGAGTIRVREAEDSSSSPTQGGGMATSGVYMRFGGGMGFSFSSSGGSGGPARPLDMRDLLALEALEGVATAASERTLETTLPGLFEDLSVTVVGTTPGYLEIQGLALRRGRFLSHRDIEEGARVAVVGPRVQGLIFGMEEPLGSLIRIKNIPYEVVGVVAPKDWSGVTLVQVRDTGKDIYVPVTALAAGTGEFPVGLDMILLRLEENESPIVWSDAVKRAVAVGHPAGAFEVIVPEALLAQEQKLQRIFSVVMGVIAGISLLVGGIGIMNITLATVVQRTREIGIRRALGAKRRDIQSQFLAESVLLSALGGLVGVGIGAGLAKAISAYAEWTTVVSPWSIGLAFGVAAAVGILFGWWPARRAALLSPVEALRHD